MADSVTDFKHAPTTNTKRRFRSRHFGTASALALLVTACDYGASVTPAEQIGPNEGAVMGETPPSSFGPNSAGGLERVMDSREPVIAETPPPPIMGGTLRILADGNTAVAADPARDVVHFVDLDAGEVIATVPLQSGARPGRIAESPGAVHVVLTGAGRVLTLDTNGNTIRQADVCAEPRGLEYVPSGQTLLLACRDGRLLSLSPQDGQLTPFASLPTDLRDVMVVTPEAGKESIFVSRFRSAELIRVHSDGSVDPERVLPDITAMRTVVTQEAADEFGNVFVQEEELVEVPMAATVAWRARAVGNDVVVLHQRAQRGEINVSSAGGYGGGCEGVVQPGVSKLDQDAAVLTSSALSLLNVGVDFAVSPDGTWWAFADAGVSDPETPREFVLTDEATPGQTSVIGVASGSTAEGTSPQSNAPVQLFSATALELSSAPDPEFACGSGPSASLAGDPGQQATAVEFNPTRPAQLVALLRQPAVLLIHDDVATSSEARRVPLGGADITDTGHDLFHRVDTAVACVHCHPGGADDGHVWEFAGFGERRTQSLETGLRAPFHWDGDLADMGELMKEVFAGRMSAAPQSESRTTALADWLSSLSPPAAGVVSDAQLVERGRQLFESADVGCASCHSGAALTDGALHAVGTTESPLKTPSLLGVAQRLPLMHDGCAASLRERFTTACGGGDQHGVTSHLSDAELDALTAYMGSL